MELPRRPRFEVSSELQGEGWGEPLIRLQKNRAVTMAGRSSVICTVKKEKNKSQSHSESEWGEGSRTHWRSYGLGGCLLCAPGVQASPFSLCSDSLCEDHPSASEIWPPAI